MRVFDGKEKRTASPLIVMFAYVHGRPIGKRKKFILVWWRRERSTCAQSKQTVCVNALSSGEDFFAVVIDSDLDANNVCMRTGIDSFVDGGRKRTKTQFLQMVCWQIKQLLCGDERKNENRKKKSLIDRRQRKHKRAWQILENCFSSLSINRLKVVWART